MESVKQETVGDLVRDINAALQRMGAKNSHRHLLIRLGNAVVTLAHRLEAGQIREVERPRV
jgi:hypothetical protein